MVEEGRVELCSEEQVYMLLGLRREDEMAKQSAREAASNSRDDGASASGIPNVEGTEGAFMPVVVIVYDKDNLSMYSYIKEFRLTLRQYVINKEIELGIESTNKERYRGYCKGGEEIIVRVVIALGPYVGTSRSQC